MILHGVFLTSRRAPTLAGPLFSTVARATTMQDVNFVAGGAAAREVTAPAGAGARGCTGGVRVCQSLKAARNVGAGPAQSAQPGLVGFVADRGGGRGCDPWQTVAEVRRSDSALEVSSLTAGSVAEVTTAPVGSVPPLVLLRFWHIAPTCHFYTGAKRGRTTCCSVQTWRKTVGSLLNGCCPGVRRLVWHVACAG